MTLEIKPYTPQDYDALIELWNLCQVPARIGDEEDRLAALALQAPELFLVGRRNNSLIASVLATYDGRRGWISHLCVHPDQQEKGIASLLLEKAEANLRARGCLQINLLFDSDNQELQTFYEKRGYKPKKLTFMYKI